MINLNYNTTFQNCNSYLSSDENITSYHITAGVLVGYLGAHIITRLTGDRKAELLQKYLFAIFIISSNYAAFNLISEELPSLGEVTNMKLLFLMAPLSILFSYISKRHPYKFKDPKHFTVITQESYFGVTEKKARVTITPGECKSKYVVRSMWLKRFPLAEEDKTPSITKNRKEWDEGVIGISEPEKYYLKWVAEIVEGEIDLGRKELEEKVIVLNSELKARDFEPIWDYKDYQISIFLNPSGQAQIKLHDLKTNKSIVEPYNYIPNCTRGGNLCVTTRAISEEADRALKRVGTKQTTWNCLDSLSRFIVVNVRTEGNFTTNGHKFEIFMEPNSAKSIINTAVLVSEVYWAVTLVCHNGPCGEHVQIIIEGVDAKKKFTKMAHFDGPGIVEYKNLGEREVLYGSRSLIFKRKQPIVARMIHHIEESVKHPPQEHSFSGPESCFSGGAPSCFSWACEMLEIMGIDPEEIGCSKIRSVVTFPSTLFYTKEAAKKLESEHSYYWRVEV